MTSQKGKPQPKYSEEFKARAVARLYAEGYPEKKGALREVAKELGVTHPTLSRWASGGSSSPPSDLIRLAVMSMQTAIEAELESILASMQAAREKADYKTLAVAFGILFDKYQLIRGAPTSRSARVTEADLKDKSDDELREIIERAEEMAEKAFSEPIDDPAGSEA